MIREENKTVIDEIGACPMTCLDAVEALQEQDCLCIGLNIARPEAAIADPSRLKIIDIYPTYMSAEGFLNSAQFSINKAPGVEEMAHGGFDAKGNYEGKLALGLGRESITGVLPLYLFKEHWAIAQKKIQPVLGFMCTLDIMGYSSEQFFTVPFLVYIKAMQMSLEKEVN